METRWIKENELANVLKEPDDDIVLVNALQNALDFCKILGELHARGVLRSKGTKNKHFFCAA